MRSMLLLLISLFVIQVEAAPRLVNFLVSNQNPQAGETFSVVVGSNNRNGIAGGQFTIQYPTPLLTLDGEPTLNSELNGFSLAYNSQEPGTLHISFAHASNLTNVDSGAFFSFPLRVHELGIGQAQINLGEIQLFDEQGSELTNTSGTLNIEINNPPTEIHEPILLRVYDFRYSTLEENGWLHMSGGFTELSPGEPSLDLLPENRLESSLDRKGLKIEADRDQIVFLYADPPIENATGAIMMKLIFQAESGNAAVWLAGLKGNLEENSNLDGSLHVSHQANTRNHAENEKRLHTLYSPEEDEIWTPVIQLLGKENDSVIWIDRLELWQLDSEFFTPSQ